MPVRTGNPRQNKGSGKGKNAKSSLLAETKNVDSGLAKKAQSGLDPDEEGSVNDAGSVDSSNDPLDR